VQSVYTVEELSQSLRNVEAWEIAVERDANAAGAQCNSIYIVNFNVSN
jgi:hypothetical protein